MQLQPPFCKCFQSYIVTACSLCFHSCTLCFHSCTLCFHSCTLCFHSCTLWFHIHLAFPQLHLVFPQLYLVFLQLHLVFPQLHLVFPQLIAGATLQAVSRSNLQLISVACMLVAAKHEEERHPSVQDFTSIADNCFLAGDLLKMESVVLQSLAFRINAPTSCTFLSMFQQGINLSPKAHAMATFFTVH